MGCHLCNLSKNIDLNNNELTTSFIEDYFDKKNQTNGVSSTNQVNNYSNNNTISKYIKHSKDYSNTLFNIDSYTDFHNNSSIFNSKVYSPIKMNIKEKNNYAQMSSVEKEEKMRKFEKDIFKSYNEIRSNPEKAISFISSLIVVEGNSNNDLILQINTTKKIRIPNAAKKIHDALVDLKSIVGLAPLKHKDELRIEIPKIVNKDNVFESDYIEYIINKKIKNFRKNRKVKNQHDNHGKKIGFQIDSSELSPFETVIVQLIDPYYDGIMRRNILNSQFKYCGICSNIGLYYKNEKIGISILFCD